MNWRVIWRPLVMLLFASLPGRAVAAQGAGTGGSTRLIHELRFGLTARRVLIIGAHPDDENTDLITILTRDMGVDAAYLSLTRGEGGQNLIGNELGTSLGVLRTEELLAARAVDGAQQYFGRAYDFGFSKSAESAFGFWPRNDLVGDVVAVIRRFRPQVVISVWSGTAADGHGQHTVAGLVAREAFDAAGDPARFPSLGTPWQPAKFYRGQRDLSSDSVLVFQGGVLDLATGLSLHQIAMRSRSQHRSQGQGQLEDLGPLSTRIRLEARAPGLTGPDDSLFAGIVPEPRTENDPHRAAARLIQAGVVVDAWVDDDEVVPDQVLRGVITVWNTGKDTVNAKGYPSSRGGWQHRFDECPARATVLPPGATFTCHFTSAVWHEAPLTTPYFLTRPMNGYLYQWDMLSGDAGRPFQPPELFAKFTVSAADWSVTVDQPVLSRSRDAVLGEVRRPVQIVPRVAVSVAPDRLLWPAASAHRRKFRISLEHLARDTTHAVVRLRVPPGWTASAPQSVVLAGEGQQVTAEFSVTTPPTVLLGEYPVYAQVVVGGDTLTHGLYRIRYPHVEPRNIVTDASASVVIANVTLPRSTGIGYVRGAADRIPEALANTGIPVRVISGAEAQQIPLDSLRVIVIGPRAYEADPALAGANARLMRWVAAGGQLVIQYQGYAFAQNNLAPHPLTFANPSDRVTERNAVVTRLDSTHVLLRSPNRIGPDDFRDWVQERGLYFAHTWDPAWTPLLEMHDTGDALRQGSLLVTKIGRGTAIYTGISFFRQLPAAVPGAWRLFMNLLTPGVR